MSLLDQFRKDTILDLDATDAEVAEQNGPFGNMTSNQFIVLNELTKPMHRNLIREAAAQAIKDVQEGVEQDDLSALCVDWMTVKLGTHVLPHLHIEGYVLAQTFPSLAHSTDDTVAHALRIVRLYGRAGIPSSRICIKIPATITGLRACRILEKEHDVRALATAVFSVAQSICAAEEANCIFTSPYVNPLSAHLVEGAHVSYKDPVTQMRGMLVTAEIQRQFRRRKVRTKVLAASLITLEETVSLSGVDRVTISPGMLKKMADAKDTPEFQDLRKRAIQSFSPDFRTSNELHDDAHFPLDEPATEIKTALADEEVSNLLTDALSRFKGAEKQLLELADKALGDQQEASIV